MWIFFSQCAVSVAAARSLPSKMGCNVKESVVIGDLYKQHRVMQAGCNVVKCSHSACFLFVEGDTFLQTPELQVLHP